MAERLHILVVDSVAAVRERLATALPDAVGDSSLDVRISTADSAAAVWNHLDAARVDCVVVSTRMVDATGTRLVTSLRTESIPVVSFVRSNPSDEDIEHLAQVVYDAVRNTVGSLDTRALFDAVDVGLVVRDYETLACIDYNEKYAEILGDDDTITDSAPVVDSEGAPDVPKLSPAELRARVGEPSDPGEHEFVRPYERPNGEQVWLHVSLTVTELSGRLRFISTVEDVTDEFTRERDLERSGELLERTQRIAKVGGWRYDLETGDVEWTDETKRIYGVPMDYEPTFEKALEFYEPDERERLETLVNRCREEGILWEEDFKLATADSSERWVRTCGQPVIHGGRIVALRGTLQDITARRSREKELERANAELEALNRIVRHDIRNDIAVIVGWAELLESHVDEDGRAILSRILSTGRHSIDITKVAGDLIETMSGGVIETQPTSLRETIDRELAVRKEAFPAAEFRLDESIPDVTVRANPLLASVFGNLFNNAVKHSKNNPVVTVAGTVDGETVTVTVADNGPGIPDRRKQLVFGKGERGLDSTGTGLGLYLVNVLVESFGGTIHLEDNDPTGTVVYIELPLASA